MTASSSSPSDSQRSTAFLADRHVQASVSPRTTFSQVALSVGTGLALGLMNASVSYIFSRSVPMALYWLCGTLIFAGVMVALWKYVFLHFQNLAPAARLTAQTVTALASFTVLSLAVVEAHYSVFGLGRSSILFPYDGGDITRTISAEAMRRAPWFFALMPIIPTTMICVVAFRQSWWRINELEDAQAELRELAVAAQLAALRAQLNPHFLFNSLNSIAELVRTDPERAEECIERLAEILRYVLQRTQGDLVPLSDELRIAHAYLEIEKARFGDALSVETHIEERARGVLLPGLTLQPLVENAVNHGISRKVGGGLITIEAVLRGGDLCIAVRDTGIGMNQSAPFDRGVGLRNLRERLTRRYGQRYEPVVRSGPEGGTSITLRVPHQLEA